MTAPDSVVIDEVFIGVYVVVFALTLVCGLRNGFSKAAGFFSLVLFSAGKYFGSKDRYSFNVP